MVQVAVPRDRTRRTSSTEIATCRTRGSEAIAFPLLLDRDVGAYAAVATSARAMMTNQALDAAGYPAQAV